MLKLRRNLAVAAIAIFATTPLIHAPPTSHSTVATSFRSADSEARSFGGATEIRASRSESSIETGFIAWLSNKPTASSNSSLVDPTAPVQLPQPVAAPVGNSSNWYQIAVCETHANWSAQGPIHSGGLGFDNKSWAAFGGLEFASNAGLATVAQQITVADRIAAGHTYYANADCSNWTGW